MLNIYVNTNPKQEDQYYVLHNGMYYPAIGLGNAVSMRDDLNAGSDGYLCATLEEYDVAEEDLTLVIV